MVIRGKQISVGGTGSCGWALANRDPYSTHLAKVGPKLSPPILQFNHTYGMEYACPKHCTLKQTSTVVKTKRNFTSGVVGVNEDRACRLFPLHSLRWEDLVCQQRQARQHLSTHPATILTHQFKQLHTRTHTQSNGLLFGNQHETDEFNKPRHFNLWILEQPKKIQKDKKKDDDKGEKQSIRVEKRSKMERTKM